MGRTPATRAPQRREDPIKVSVIIATYGEDIWADLALSRALPSVAHTDADIRIGHYPEATIAGARNFLARKASGDWLCFLDADDELAPDYLDQMAMVGGDWDVLLTPKVRQIRKGRVSSQTFYPECDLLTANWLIVGTLIRRETFFRAGGFSDYPHGFEDWSLWYKATRLGCRVTRVPKAIYIQHINPQSKHRQGWRDRRWQVETHQRVQRELEAWTPSS